MERLESLRVGVSPGDDAATVDPDMELNTNQNHNGDQQVSEKNVDADSIASAHDPKKTCETTMPPAESSLSTSPVSTRTSSEESSLPPRLSFVRSKLAFNRYVPTHQRRYRNSLLAAVGYLELANALDFPANVWNQIPLPTFAVVLMAVGGSIALLWSIFAFRDLHLSRKNIALLRDERRYLKALQMKYREQEHASEKDTRLLQVESWLALNFRELGWEFTDRVLMDFLVGISSIMVGVGTILAIGGANRRIFHASNLLSGYVGNSFVAFYGLCNACWSVFVFRRFNKHNKTVVSKFVKDDGVQEGQILGKLKRHGRRHQKYAVFNGIFTLVASVGSLMSATLWYGYVVLVPCVVSSIYVNWLWRKRIGYDREIVTNHRWQFDFMDEVKSILAIKSRLTESNGCAVKADWFSGSGEKAKSESVVSFLLEQGLYEDFCLYLVRHDIALVSSVLDIEAKSVLIDAKSLMAAERRDQVTKAAMEFMKREGVPKLKSRERVMLELLGYYSYCLSRSM